MSYTKKLIEKNFLCYLTAQFYMNICQTCRTVLLSRAVYFISLIRGVMNR